MKSTKLDTSASCAGIIVLLLISGAIGAICWPYTINHWLAFAGKSARIVWWQGALIGFCPYIGQASIPAAVVTFILSLFGL
jgi:hypothetical protein